MNRRDFLKTVPALGVMGGVAVQSQGISMESTSPSSSCINICPADWLNEAHTDWTPEGNMAITKINLFIQAHDKLLITNAELESKLRDLLPLVPPICRVTTCIQLCDKHLISDTDMRTILGF